MSRVEDMARKVAKETVRETLLALGVDASDGKSVTEAQKDFAFLRRARKVALHVLMLAVGLAVTAALHAASK